MPVPKVVARAGSRVQMECNIQAFPRAELSWEFSSERGEEPRPLQTGGKYNKEEFLLSQYNTRTVLTIANFTKEVAGLRTEDRGQILTNMINTRTLDCMSVERGMR